MCFGRVPYKEGPIHSELKTSSMVVLSIASANWVGRNLVVQLLPRMVKMRPSGQPKLIGSHPARRDESR